MSLTEQDSHNTISKIMIIKHRHHDEDDRHDDDDEDDHVEPGGDDLPCPLSSQVLHQQCKSYMLHCLPE